LKSLPFDIDIPYPTDKELLLDAIETTKVKFTKRNLNVPTQYSKFFDRLNAIVSSIDEIPVGTATPDFLAKLAGAVSTDRNFALTLTVIKNNAGSDFFGVRFNAIDDADFEKILKKNNVNLSIPEAKALDDLVVSSQQFKNESAIAAQNGTVANRAALNTALDNANKVFKTPIDPDEISKITKLALDSGIAPDDASFIARASQFAKALNVGGYLVGGILDFALGITSIVKNPNDPRVIAQGALGITAGTASFFAGLAALGVISAAALPPLAIIAGVLSVVGFIVSLARGESDGPDLYGAVDLFERLEEYDFAKPGSVEIIQDETDAQLDEKYPDTSLSPGS
jgi:hypothetical protein